MSDPAIRNGRLQPSGERVLRRPHPRLLDEANDRLPTGMDVDVLNRNPLLAVAETGLEIVRGVRFCLLVDVAIAQLRGAALAGIGINPRVS
jgi:hypothetical protein